VPLHDERDEPLFPELMAELDAIKSRTLSGLMIRRVPLPWITTKGGLDYMRGPSRRSSEPPSSATISLLPRFATVDLPRQRAPI
jgi:hypothetical protein